MPDNNSQEPGNSSRQLGMRIVLCLLLACAALAYFVASRRSHRTETPIIASAEIPLTNSSIPNRSNSWHFKKKPAGSASPVSPVAPAPATELVYQKKTLSEWIAGLESNDSETVTAAQEAFRAMGPDARDAIPRLADLLDPARSPNAAAFALVSIGKDSLPVLLNALTNSNPITRLEVAGAIGGLREDGEEAVPALVDCLQDESSGIRANAIAALQSIPKRPDIVVPALITCMADDDPSVRGNAVTVLSKFSKDAESAIPELVRVAKEDYDEDVRTKAIKSLKEISPERARAEGL
jgi:HEAT repeats